MGKLSNGSEYERLKAELRRMRRQSAPWYFESALHQRLHGGARRRPRLRPISTGPVLVVAVVTLAILAFALYAVLVRSNLFPHAGEPARPADTLSVSGPPDSVRAKPERATVRPRETPRAETHPPRVQAGAADTLPAHPRRGGVTLDVDTALSRHDSAVTRRDTAMQGPDTTRRPP